MEPKVLMFYDIVDEETIEPNHSMMNTEEGWGSKDVHYYYFQ